MPDAIYWPAVIGLAERTVAAPARRALRWAGRIVRGRLEWYRGRSRP